MILDYHFLGQQAQFEQEQPEMIDAAKMFLGEELYEQLGAHVGIPLGKHDAAYEPLMNKYHALVT